MGAFAQALQSLGGLGNDLGTAQQNVKTQAFTDQLNALKLRQLQLALDKSTQDPLQAKIASIEAALKRPLTDAERQTVVGLEPKPAAQSTPFEVWRAQNPTASIGDWLALEKPSTAPKTAFETWREQNPAAPVSDWLKLSKPAPASPENTPFETWRRQNPSASVGDWLKLQSQYRKTAGGGEGTGPSSLYDPSIQAAAAGQINPPNPATKIGAAWWKRADELGVADVIRTRSFAGGAQNSVTSAQKAYDVELDKFNRWKSDHYLRAGMGSANPYEASLAEKLAQLNMAKGAAGGGSSSADPTSIPGVTPAP